ncbi:class I SAM-dependent methyltransferase [Enterovirga rhinocerotis]|uniref:Methyltransferase family protein n=1 Tax=Enterovirga rhinocerotis TaxID=1339210 RepID=A0A4R7BU45_9HYPH|nr:class I SAM-dependent methyltransferase [Enterovirga rhinocerotis]TDR89288.1 methyltransferase family protein [Enterovirga rhinocerotis]
MLITSLNRVQLLQKLPNGGVCAEIGVYNGAFASQILKNSGPRKLHLIDPWGGQEDEYVSSYHIKGELEEKFLAVSKMFEKKIEDGTVEIHREYSTTAVKRFKDKYFDWVYIDAMHSYDGVLSDLRAFRDKVVDDGFLFGHDFSNTKMSRAKKFGVIPAVIDFVNETGYKLILMTNESAPSYLIAKNPESDRCRELIQSIVDSNTSTIDIDPKLVSNLQQFEVLQTGGRKLQFLQLGAGVAPGHEALPKKFDPNAGETKPSAPSTPAAAKPAAAPAAAQDVAPADEERRKSHPLRSLLDDGIFTYENPRPQLPIFYALLTRFNMFLPQFRDTGRILSEEDFAVWLKKRAAIFAQTCLPSVVGQARRPDRWFIGFDETRRDHIQPVLDLIKPYPWIVPVWQRVINGEHESARLVFVRSVAEALRPDHRYVLTSRVDNDDAINKLFCEAVDDYAAAVYEKLPDERDFWISFPYGMQYNGDTCRVFPLNNNAFLSKFERADAFPKMKGATALSGNHSRVFSKGRVFTPMTRFPMWIQMVHGSNVSNSSSSILSALADEAAELKRFSLRPLGGMVERLAAAS